MPDMLLRVGRGKTPNVFYNTGHGHLGWTLAAATAEMVSQEVEGALLQAPRMFRPSLISRAQ
jgi:D-amino-acid dehydrogenase